MTNLVPELRPDYTGKMVTRHVRSDVFAASARSFPSPLGTPALKDSEEFTAIKVGLTSVLNEYLALADADQEDFDEEEYEDPGFDPKELIAPSLIGGALAKLPERTLSHMRAKIDEDRFSDDFEVAALHVLTYHDGDHQLMDYLIHLHENAGDLYPESDIFGNADISSYTLVRDYVQGLRKHERVGYELPENIFEATSEDRILMEALHTLNVEQSDKNGNVDEELVKVVLDYPNDVDRIFAVMDERETADPEIIRDILQSEAPSLSNGIL